MGEARQAREPFDVDKLFQSTMERKWDEVLKVYKMYEAAHSARLTKSEETALHIAVSSYHEDLDTGWIWKLVETLSPEEADKVLGISNDKGNTPLHLAAALGSVDICRCIASKSHKLMTKRNGDGETPFFLAAKHGKADAFGCLYKVWIEKRTEEPVEKLLRRYDGCNILHEAIRGEYFDLAYQIILKHKNLVVQNNEEGLSPLHILAKKPSVFYSSSNLRLFDRIRYNCLIVRKLKKKDFVPESFKNSSSHYKSNGKCPDNYETCMNLVRKSWSFFKNILVSSGSRNDKDHVKDEESQGGNNTGKSSASRMPEMEEKYRGSFPPNYATCINLFKFAVNIMLIILGVGISTIKEIKKKKEKHTWAYQIMDKLMEHEKGYKYSYNGQAPGPEYEAPSIPSDDEQDNPSTGEKNTSKKNEESDEAKPVEEDTFVIVTAKMKSKQAVEELHRVLPDAFEKPEEKDPPQSFLFLRYQKQKPQNTKSETESVILFAAKWGITEMVDKILETFPVAIEDVDKQGKNALLLAIENRQTKVFDLLIKKKLPEFVLYKVDDEGNTALHLAATLQPQPQPWRIPGAALQMQGEIKWYKHVKKIMPSQYLVQHRVNKKGETARMILTRTHEMLMKDGSEWLFKTAKSCSVVAALIATVALATSTTVPGGFNDGIPNFKGHPAFNAFSITSLVALCFAVTSLVFFLAILTSRCQKKDFTYGLPWKLLLGLSTLFTSITAILFSFCAAHFFILQDELHNASLIIYGITCLPVTFFLVEKLPLYFDLLWSIIKKVPPRSYEEFS